MGLEIGATKIIPNLIDPGNFVVVQSADSATQNGTNLLAAYAAAKLLTPNGAALSATNRASVIIPPGVYDLGSTALTLDTQYVDIIGLTSDYRSQHIKGTPAATNSGVIVQTANDVHISNLTAEILTAYGTPNGDSTDSAAYFPSTNLNNTVVENVYFKGNDGSSSVLWSTRLATEYSGTFTNCIGESAAFGDIASGMFTDCTGGNFAFGSGGATSGTFNHCTGGAFSFSDATPCASVATITLVAGGTGYTANDELTVVGGTGDAATIKVLTVNAGVILTAEILTVGSYTVEPSNAVAVTGGTGNNDATFDLTWHEGHVYGCIDSTGFIAEVNWNDGA